MPRERPKGIVKRVCFSFGFLAQPGNGAKWSDLVILATAYAYYHETPACYYERDD